MGELIYTAFVIAMVVGIKVLVRHGCRQYLNHDDLYFEEKCSK